MRCWASLGAAVAIWAIGTSSAFASPLGAVEETAGSVIELVPQAETTTQTLPSVDVPPATRVPPRPTTTLATPPAPSAAAAAAEGAVNQVSNAAAKPLDATNGDAGSPSPTQADPGLGTPRTSGEGSGGEKPHVQSGASPTSAGGDRSIESNVMAPVPRWFAYVWPAIALGPGRSFFVTLALFVGPGAGRPLLISVPSALLGLRDALREGGVALAAAAVVDSADTNRPFAAIFDDSGPRRLKTLLFVAALLLVSYFVIRRELQGALRR